MCSRRRGRTSGRSEGEGGPQVCTTAFFPPPFLVLYADHDMAARAEENAFFVALMRAAGNKRIASLMIMDRTHGSIASGIENEGDPARAAILGFIQAESGKR
jgi:hypothetical protein